MMYPKSGFSLSAYLSGPPRLCGKRAKPDKRRVRIYEATIDVKNFLSTLSS